MRGGKIGKIKFLLATCLTVIFLGGMMQPFLSIGEGQAGIVSSIKATDFSEKVVAPKLLSAKASVEDRPYCNIRLGINFSSPSIKNMGDYDRITMQGLYNLNEPGVPVLPFKIMKILLPPDRNLKDVMVVPDSKITLDGQFNIELGQTPRPIGCIQQENTSEVCLDNFDKLEYQPNSNIDKSLRDPIKPFPSEPYSVEGEYRFRGYQILLVNLNPVEYVAKTGTVSYFETMNIYITTDADASRNCNIPDFRGLPQDMDRVKDIVDNPSMTDTYNTFRKGLSRPSYDYVIITNEKLDASFQPLASWKNQKGVSTTIVTVENITSNQNYWNTTNPLFNDTQAQIRNFIIHAYNNWGIDYILLGGDVEIIPHRGFYGSTSGYIDEDIPSDLYYGALDGNWNNDGDGLWGESGEEDLYAEVYVGRAPVNTPIEASNFVDKIITYETNPSLEYYNNALMLGAKCDAYTDSGDLNDHICNSYIPQSYNITKLYERDGNATVSNTTNFLNAGQHIVNCAGHAGNHVLCLASVDYYENYYESDVDALVNSPKYSLFCASGCYANAFDNRGGDGYYVGDSISEHFINNPNGGAFAFIGNSRYGWYTVGQPLSGTGQYYIEFFKTLFVDNITNVGKTLQCSKENLAGSVPSDGTARWSYYTVNLLGDPETSIGNRTQQTHEVGVVRMEAPSACNVTDAVFINATIMNRGLNDETDVDVNLLINGAVNNTTAITSILSGASRDVSFSLTAPAEMGIVNVTIQVQNVINETILCNNLRTKLLMVISNWVITDQQTISDQMINLTGNLTVTGSLTLSNVTLNMTSVIDGFFGIYVYGGGKLYIYDSTLTSYYEGYHYQYKFEAWGQLLYIENCNISYLWGSTSGEHPGGIQLYSNNAQILNSHISHSTSHGIYCQSSTGAIIHNNTIESNWVAGIYLYSSSSNQITNCEIYSNSWHGIYLKSSSNNQISDCTTSNNNYGIYLDSSSSNILRDNVLENNTYSFSVYDGYTQDIDTSNTINGKPIYYITGQSNLVFDGSTMGIGYLGLFSCSNIIIKNLTFTNSSQGLLLVSTSYSTITNYTVYNNYCGIYMQSSSNNSFTDCTVYSSSKYGIYVFYYSSNNNFTNCAVHNNSEYGIFMFYYSSNNQFTNCTVHYNYKGIWAQYYSNNIQITNCDVYNNSEYGIYLDSSSNNNITDCTAYNNGPAGIWIYKSSNNQITNCTTYNNHGYGGIWLVSLTTNSIVTNCTAYDNARGIVVDSSSTSNQVTNCTAYKNSGAGIMLWDYSTNNLLTNCTAYNNSAGILLETVSNNQIANCSIYNNSDGIKLDSSSANDITNCTVYNNGDGITLWWSSSNNNITDCNVYNSSDDGIWLGSSSNNIINCHVYNNSGDGIEIQDTSNNRITDCNFYNNYDGVKLTSSSNNNITNCDAYDNSHDGISLVSSSNNNITNCDVHNNSGHGIELWDSSNNNFTNCAVYNNNCDGICLGGASLYSPNNTISNCTVYNNYRGIWVHSSSNNTVANCTVYNNNNTYGIYLECASDNLIYNNYFDNTNNSYSSGGTGNRWNITKTAGTNIVDGSFLGGNYWSDYTGIDSDGDGIGETPYTIPGGSGEQDQLPLVKPNNPPTLSNGAVNPTIGDTATWFNFTVKYNDSDNHAPAAGYPKVEIECPLGTPYCTFTMNPGIWVSDTGDYTAGRNYYYNTTLAASTHYNFTFNASDGQGDNNWAAEPAWDDAPDVSQAPNQPPIIQSYNPVSDPTIIETESIMFNITASDPDNDTLIIQWYLNGALVATGDSYTFVSDYDSAGTYIVNVTVSDGEYNVSHEWILTVNNMNRPPVIETYSPETDPTITEEENQTFTVTISDPDDDTLTTEWYLNKTLVDTDTSYTFIGNYTSAGWYEVKVVVSDGSLYVNRIWTLTVTNVNRAPVLANPLPDRSFDEDTVLSNAFNLNDYFSDPDNENLDYIVYGNDNISVMINSNGTVDFSASGNWYGYENITFRATDPYSAFAEDNITITVNPVNDPPDCADIVMDIYFEEDATTNMPLDEYVEDVDNLDNEITWWLTWEEDGIVYTSAWGGYSQNGKIYISIDLTTHNTTLTPESNWNGFDSIVFIATDPEGEGDSFVQGVWVQSVNDPPAQQYSLPDVSFEEDTEIVDAFNLNDYFSDIDGILSFSHYGNESISVVINKNGSVNFSAFENWCGCENITFVAADGEYNVSDTIMVTINPVNDAPVIVGALPIFDKDEDDPIWVLDLTNNKSDVDNTLSELVWSVSNWNTSLFDSVTVVDNNITFDLKANAYGNNEITITISDGLLTDSQNIWINVTSINDPPTITGLTDQPIVEDVTFWYDIIPYISDIDNDISDLVVTTNSSYITVHNGNHTLEMTYPDGVIVDYIRITVSDGILSDYEDVVFTITPVNDAPVISGVPDQFGVEDAAWTLDITSYISDVDNTTEELTVTVNSSYVTVDGKVLTFLYPNGIITDSVKITVSDGITTANQTITVTITPVNDAPTISGVPAQYATEDTDLYLNISSYISDVDNSTDELTITTNSSYATINGFIITFNYPNGILSENLRITVSDGINTSYQDIMVVVTSVNDAPVINSFTPTTGNPTIDEGKEQVFTVSASDVDNTDLTITWYLDNNAVASGSTYTFSSDYTSAGTYTVKVVVSDGSLTDEKIWTLTVNEVKKEEPKGFIPGFETTTFLIAMIGVCIVLLRKRRR